MNVKVINTNIVTSNVINVFLIHESFIPLVSSSPFSLVLVAGGGGG